MIEENYNTETETENEDEDITELDQKMIDFINFVNNKEKTEIPVPTYFVVSTRSGMCKMNNVNILELSKIISFISNNIISNIIFNKNPNYLIQGIVIENIILRFDESYLKKYIKPYIKFFGNVIDYKNM